MLQPNASRKTLSELAYEHLREAIIHLRLEPGQMVYEAEISEGLGMSRTPIREAFRMLLTEELIEVLPQRGGRISLISEQKVEEARFVRHSLESSAMRKAAGSWNPDDSRHAELLRQIRVTIAEQKQATRDGDMIAFLQADERFHRLLLSLSGNATLISVVSSMRGHLNRLRLLSLSELNDGERLIAEHESLIRAVTSRDEQAAEEALEHHLGKLNEELPVIKAKYGHYFRP
ncbi:GntR family transcriptional regulator [Paenibacillus hamazuiensis]|uniref:GntR family transcriptional regulator n=1 Tax=Paenibacillus hamazuiensis TaxID=2936508 RepID=UPI00200D82B1|nr:GntR family transcriptional regulator [Paenibacillus hamazuiensis]